MKRIKENLHKWKDGIFAQMEDLILLSWQYCPHWSTDAIKPILNAYDSQLTGLSQN
jgi:hypothetical protein